MTRWILDIRYIAMLGVLLILMGCATAGQAGGGRPEVTPPFGDPGTIMRR